MQNEQFMEPLLTILAAVFGGGWLTQVLYMRYEKRKKHAETRTAEIDVDIKEDQVRDAKLVRAYEQIVELQSIVDQERGKWVALAKEISEIKQKLLKEREARELAEFDKCTKTGCTDRIPPRSGGQAKHTKPTSDTGNASR